MLEMILLLVSLMLSICDPKCKNAFVVVCLLCFLFEQLL